MCYSPEASFTVSAALVATGAYTALKARGTPWIWFALTPLLFGIQQAAEGIVWIYLQKGQPDVLCARIATYTYLSFAYLLWPVWFPFSLLSIEQSPGRKRIIQSALLIGALISFGCFIALLRYDYTPEIRHESIWYDSSGLLHRATYLFPLLLAMGASSYKEMVTYAVVVATLFLVSQFFYEQVFTSIWCFYAAVISLFIAFIVRKHCHKDDEK